METEETSRVQAVEKPVSSKELCTSSTAGISSGTTSGLDEARRIIWLIAILTIITTLTLGAAVFVLYRTAIAQQRERLIEAAQSQARLIEAIARFDISYTKGYPGGPDAATLNKISDAHSRYRGFGETGEFVLARREQDSIVFLLRHRHYDLDHPQPVPWNSNLAEPMRRALSGEAGTIVGLDYRGEYVLAAYEPVRALNAGIVAKIDLAEIRLPFLRAGLVSGIVAVSAILLGAWLFIRITRPVIQRLKERTAEMEALNVQREQEIGEHKRTEELLREEKSRAQQYLDIAGTIIVVIDSDQKVSLINRRGCEILGWDEPDIVGKNWFDHFVPEQSAQKVKEAFDGLMTDRALEMASFENPILSKDGEKRLVAWHNSVLRDGEGNIVATLSSGEDITERRRAEEALEWELRVNAALAELASALVGPTRPVDEIADIVLERVRELTNSEHGYVSSIDPKTRDNVIHTFSRMMDSCPVSEKEKKTVFAIGKDGLYPALWGYPLNTKKAFYVVEPGLHEAAAGTPSGHIPLNAFLSIPVMIGGELYGQIALANPECPYSDRELTAVQRVGELYALALQRQRGQLKLLDYQQNLESLVEKRTQHLKTEILQRQRTEQELRRLSGRLITAQEEERSRIARELHDDLNQKLALLAVRLEQMGQRSDDQLELLRRESRELWEVTRELSSDVYRLSHKLRPALLEHVGLATALHRLCNDLAKQSSVEIRFRGDEIPRSIPEEVSLCLYRIAQEALHNVVRHSGASDSEVELVMDSGKICLRVKDSGEGFDSHPAEPAEGLGLANMRERARLVGGRMIVSSLPSKGTRIEVIVPMDLSKEGSA